ncbi:MAG: NYN domain-containing protein [Candidatus Aadella gelida]|nr:NYN domain-containing protein [Candidatus Aadella gelida]
MKLLILDAYNVIYELPELSDKIKSGLCEARRGLLNFMINWKQGNGFNGKICIVYDGQDGVVNFEGSKLWGVECVFTGSKEEADDRIISIVSKTSKASDVVVVSGDGKVANGCKVYGVKVERPEFLKRKRKKKYGASESRSKNYLSGKVQNEINKYYEEALEKAIKG